MKRREMLLGSGAVLLGLSSFRLGWTAPADKKKQKVLYFTRSAGFEHSAIQRRGGALGSSEKLLTDWGQHAGFEVECTKDGRVFDGDLDQYDLIAFFTSGDLTKPDPHKDPPMTPAGKQKLLDAIAAGKGFVGFHSATDTFRSSGIDPYIAMIGGEFLTHGEQQKAPAKITSPKFPGVRELHVGTELSLLEEWYAHQKFANDLHVILLLETAAMKGTPYARPPMPVTWARMHQKGRVFYTSFGHREDIWTNPSVKAIMLGGIAWGLGNAQADVAPNIAEVAPKANQLKND
jgi:type 1 glutamine amidotransferase